CPLCEKSFSFKTNVQRHIKERHFPTKFKCRYCAKKFSRPGNLNDHMIQCHRTFIGSKRLSAVDLYVCECGKSFRTSSGFADHKRTHEGNFRYFCPICTKGYNNKQQFIGHMNKHSNNKPFTCDWCGKSFTLKHNLSENFIQTQIETFECDVCGKIMTTVQGMKNHKRQHDGHFRYRCTICNKGMNHRHHYEGHMHTHQNSKPHKCDLCGKSFAFSTALKRHRARCALKS
ncbi:hypothetical protein LOTGIDRAFT_115282, partial [Lottia gigantea]